MGEWRRILANPRRLAVLILIPVVSLIIYFMGWSDSIRLRDMGQVMEDKRFLAGLIEEYRGRPLEEASQELRERSNRLAAVSSWINGWGESTREDVQAILEDYPELLPLFEAEDYTTLRRTIGRMNTQRTKLAEQIEYWKGYPAYLVKIRDQAEQQTKTTIFGDPKSFAYRNLVKTAAQFESLRLKGVTAEYGNNQAVEAFLQYRLADYLYVVIMIIMVMAFLEERRKGLWSTIRSCPGGRLKLGLVRLGILAATAAIYTLLLYGANLVVGFALEGGWSDLARPLQSIESFKTCSLNVTIGQWILIYLGLKVVTGVLIGTSLWLILGRISNIQFSIAVLGVVLAAEYLLFALLPVQSVFNPVKYINLFSYIHLSELYTQYLNINLFGYPVGIRPLMLGHLPVLLLAFGGGVLLMQQRRYPEGNRDWLGKIAGLWRRVMDVPRRWLSIGGMEGYKILVLELTAVMLLLTWWVAGRLSYVHPTSNSLDSQWYRAYLKDAEGPADAQMDDYLAFARSQVPAEGEMSAQLGSALDQLEYRVAQLRERAGARDYDPWLINESTYESIYGSQAEQEQRQTAAVALIMTLLCCAGIMAYETQSGVVPLVRSLKRGRRGMWRRKICYASLMAAAVWALVYGREWASFRKICSPATLDAAVQNLDMLQRFPVVMTLRTYLIVLYALRLLMLLAAAWAAIWISSRMKTLENAYILNLTVVGFPAFFLVLGIGVCGYISPVIPVASAELMIGLGKGWQYLIPWIIWFGLGTAGMCLAWRRWVRT